MAKYIIHACPERMWYVDNYLVPSMKGQGIHNIDIKCDNNHIGCLESCMQIFRSMDNEDEGSWHLQDDIIICSKFKKLTEQYNDGIVCAFTNVATTKIGHVKPVNMWWSFPCIRIPDHIARECAEWYYSFAKGYAKFWEWVQMKKCDDNFFKEFLIRNYPDMDILNLVPNLVDHIDYLIGGSTVNQYRGDNHITSQYFSDKHLIKILQEELIRDGKR